MAKRIEEKLGDCTIRVMPVGDIYRGAVLRKGKMSDPLEDSDPERLLARLRNEAGRLHPNYFGIDGAIERFLSFFPGGFSDALYLADERSYKMRSQETLASVLTLEDAINATPEQASEVRRALVTNLLSPFELARTSAVLRGTTGAAYMHGAAIFALGEYATGLSKMSAAVEPHGRFTWPIATYLPNLWKPAEHMFLKPVATKDFAERIGHPFQYDYDPGVSADVYRSLLDLVADTEADLSKLHPQDRIDVQSFIWVVGDYGDKEAKDLAERRAQSNS
jgi:hypothetical protein